MPYTNNNNKAPNETHAENQEITSALLLQVHRLRLGRSAVAAVSHNKKSQTASLW